MIYTAMTPEGKKVEGFYVYTHYRNRIIYEDLEGFYCEDEIDPSTLRVLINGKEYTVEEVELIVKMVEDAQNIHNGGLDETVQRKKS